MAWRRARRYAVRFPGVATLAPLLPRIPSWRRQAPLALFLAALAAFAFALARPQATVAVPREQATIVLVTDVSRSMLADDVEPSRIEAARDAAQRFLEELPDEARVGAVAFSTDPHTVEAPTDDHRRIADLIDALAADGGTATGDALDTALKLVDGPVKKRPPAAIVLLSDGETTTGRDPVEVARVAKRLKIPIHTVALGTREGVIHVARRRSHTRRAGSRDDAPHRRAVRGALVRGRGRRRPVRPLPRPRLPRGHQEGGARDHRGVRGRREGCC